MDLAPHRKLIATVRHALGYAESYMGADEQIGCVRLALKWEAHHLNRIGLYTRAQRFFDAADALEALGRGE